jgi:hypothetical protein
MKKRKPLDTVSKKVNCWKRAWWFLKKLKVELLYETAIPHLAVYPMERKPTH